MRDSCPIGNTRVTLTTIFEISNFELTSGTARVWAYWVSLLDKIIGCWFRIEWFSHFVFATCDHDLTNVHAMKFMNQKILVSHEHDISCLVCTMIECELLLFSFSKKKKSILVVNMLWYTFILLSTSTYYSSSHWHHCPLVILSSRSAPGWSWAYGHGSSGQKWSYTGSNWSKTRKTELKTKI